MATVAGGVRAAEDTTRHLKNTMNDADDGDDTIVATLTRFSLSPAVFDRLRSASNRLLSHLEAEVEADDYEDSNWTVYNGRAGQALLCLHMAIIHANKRQEFLRRAERHVNACLGRMSGGKRISFLCGDPGPLAIAAVLSHMKGDVKARNMFASRLVGLEKAAIHHDQPDELLYGRVGFIYALEFVRHHCASEAESLVPDAVVGRVVRAVVESGARYSRRKHHRLPLMFEWHDSEYVGAAHGVAGVLYWLLSCRRHLLPGEMETLVRPSVDALARTQFESGNFPSSLGSDSEHRDKLVQFCHGAPGVALLFAKAAEVLGADDPASKQQYLRVAAACCDVTWRRGLLRKGYGLCHGAAGNAYAFLRLYAATGDIKQLRRAVRFAEWCADFGRHGCEQPDQPYCFINGIAGTVYFLEDVANRGALYNFSFPTLSVD